MKRAVLLIALALAACDGNSVTKTLGLASASPDEFKVTTRAPLSLPPDLAAASLPTPTPGLARPQETPLTQQAQQTLDPDTSLNTTPQGSDSAGQEALIAAAGPAAPANIRAEVAQTAIEDANVGLTRKLMFWQGQPEPGTVVDAAAEEARLQKDAALGESPTTGQTPVIDRTKKKFLGLF